MNGRRLSLGVASLLIAVSLNLHADEEPAGSRFEPDADVLQIIMPLIERVAAAPVTRVTVQTTAETVRDGELIETKTAKYQVASRAPRRCTVYYKSDDAQVRLYRDGRTQVAAFQPDQFARLPEPGTFDQLVRVQPVPMGIFAEPILALSLAGADPRGWMLDGMASVTSLGKQKFRGVADAHRIRGQQNDGVVWDLWLRDDAARTPLRLTLDLTPMLRTSDGLRVPEGLQMSVRMDFLSYRTEGEVAESMFVYRPPAGAKEFTSYQQYADEAAAADGPAIGIGSVVGDLGLKTIDGQPWDDGKLQGSVTVLDFFATWCTPCTRTINAMSQSVAGRPGVRYVAVDVGENPALVRGFADQQGWTASVLIDRDGQAIAATGGSSIPRTVVIGPDRTIAWIDTGTGGRADLPERLIEHLEP